MVIIVAPAVLLVLEVPLLYQIRSTLENPVVMALHQTGQSQTA